MKVSGIFKTLIVVVICIIVGATAINIFLPNVVAQMSNAIEGTLYQATGLSFDFNADGYNGKSAANSNLGTGGDAKTAGKASQNNSKNKVQGFTQGK